MAVLTVTVKNYVEKIFLRIFFKLFKYLKADSFKYQDQAVSSN